MIRGSWASLKYLSHSRRSSGLADKNSSSRSSASWYMVRSFHTLMECPSRPSRSWQKKIGPWLESLANSPARKIKGEVRKSKTKPNTTSSVRFSKRFCQRRRPLVNSIPKSPPRLQTRTRSTGQSSYSRTITTCWKYC